MLQLGTTPMTPSMSARLLRSLESSDPGLEPSAGLIHKRYRLNGGKRYCAEKWKQSGGHQAWCAFVRYASALRRHAAKLGHCLRRSGCADQFVPRKRIAFVKGALSESVEVVEVLTISADWLPLHAEVISSPVRPDVCKLICGPVTCLNRCLVPRVRQTPLLSEPYPEVVIHNPLPKELRERNSEGETVFSQLPRYHQEAANRKYGIPREIIREPRLTVAQLSRENAARRSRNEELVRANEEEIQSRSARTEAYRWIDETEDLMEGDVFPFTSLDRVGSRMDEKGSFLRFTRGQDKLVARPFTRPVYNSSRIGRTQIVHSWDPARSDMYQVKSLVGKWTATRAQRSFDDIPLKPTFLVSESDELYAEMDMDVVPFVERKMVKRDWVVTNGWQRGLRTVEYMNEMPKENWQWDKEQLCWKFLGSVVQTIVKQPDATQRSGLWVPPERPQETSIRERTGVTERLFSFSLGSLWGSSASESNTRASFSALLDDTAQYFG